ncbi:potassium channel family protein [Streptomyces sp. NPDC059909]|uniref:potassium channel family protein n=1 Tax=Streptomyces sp. NPDC059909 TaxID=3346998 RepID=UPI00364D8E03
MARYLDRLRRGTRRISRTPRRGAAAARGADDLRVAVIGLGRFGVSLGSELMRRGGDVLGVDSDAGLVQRLRDQLTHVAAADCTDPEALDLLGVAEFCRAVVGIGNALEASILVTSNLADAGVPHIWAKAVGRRHGRILERVGAHHVVLPEQDMGERDLVTGRMLDFIQFDDDYALAKTVAPSCATGRPLGGLGVRAKYGITVVGIKRSGEDFTYATAETVVRPGELIVVTGRARAVESIAELV